MGYKVLLFGSPENNWYQTIEEVFKYFGKVDYQICKDFKTTIPIANYDLVIVDSQEVNDVNSLVSRLCYEFNESKVIVVTSSPTWRRAREVFKAGASDYIHKSYNKGALRKLFSKLLPSL